MRGACYLAAALAFAALGQQSPAQPGTQAPLIRPAESNQSDDSAVSPSAQEDSSVEFVFAGDLARQLRRIDPEAKVNWETPILRIEVKGQKFAISIEDDDMSVNGAIERAPQRARVEKGEIYVPRSVVRRIGVALEEQQTADDQTTDTLEATPTPVAETTTTLEATPTPEVTPTPVVTPAVTATPEPEPAVPTATPFPQATPTPTPRPTPTPKPTSTPTPKPTPARAGQKRPAAADSPKVQTRWERALREKVQVAQYKAKDFSRTDLESRAAQGEIKSVLIYSDASDLQYGVNTQDAAHLTFDVAQRLQAQLESRNISATVIRKEDVYLDLRRQLEVLHASTAQAFIILSVSHNAEFQEMGGYRIFYMNDVVDPPLQDSETASLPPERYYVPFQAGNRVLATAMQAAIRPVLGNREPISVSPAPLYLLKRAPMVSVNVVMGYLTNPADNRRLKDLSQQDSLASAIADGIVNYNAALRTGNMEGGQ